MTLAAGTVEYTLGAAPVTGCGLSWSVEELDTALAGLVAEIVFDDAGAANLTAFLESVPEAEFDASGVARVLEAQKAPEDWRVGEALAEAYLITHRACHFPWPDNRDERKSGSSLPGADLVGLQRDGELDRFAFGEVKTSGEAQYPPGAMHGHTGLKQQLEDLRNEVSIRDTLVKYLGYRALNASWKDRFICAFQRYNADNTDVQLFGFLVRDVAPHEDDLRVRVSQLGRDCPAAMSIELLAIYLSPSSVRMLSQQVVSARKGRGT